MKTGSRLSVVMLLSIVPAISLFQACMKKACITCNTSYPIPLQDTFHMRDSAHYHCDVTIEKEEHIEQKGTRDTVIAVNGKQHTVRILTDCQ